MIRYLVKRIWYGILVLFGVVSLIFFLFNVLPGDPARMVLGQRADIASVEAINKDLGRDKTVTVQYLLFLNDLSPVSFHNLKDLKDTFYLDSNRYESYIPLLTWSGGKTLILKQPYLRKSYQSKRPVADILAEAFPPTMILLRLQCWLLQSWAF